MSFFNVLFFKTKKKNLLISCMFWWTWVIRSTLNQAPPRFAINAWPLRRKKGVNRLVREPPGHANEECTWAQNNQESRRKYWATRLFIRSFTLTAYFFTCSALLASSHTPSVCTLRSSVRSLAHSVTPELVGKWMIWCLRTTRFCPTVCRLGSNARHPFMTPFIPKSPRTTWYHQLNLPGKDLKLDTQQLAFIQHGRGTPQIAKRLLCQ